ncbi:hypothetical protein CEXT_341621 [Caerostris extrusa]|uniref:Uncharacterized protein n=1 Tax=Caerostris extrusa TaxID=172846 RepID=A0AAV4P5M3_CAEEX|nr:hypothetical protein CEXT_341621 [Caerostris extrusa]
MQGRDDTSRDEKIFMLDFADPQEFWHFKECPQLYVLDLVKVHLLRHFQVHKIDLDSGDCRGMFPNDSHEYDIKEDENGLDKQEWIQIYATIDKDAY